jgi:phage-related protein
MSILTPVFNFISMITGAFNQFADILMFIIFGLIDKGVSWITGKFKEFGSFIMGVLKAIPDFILNMWGYFEQFIAWISEKFPIVGEIFSAIGKWFSDVVTGVKQRFVDMINWIINKLNFAMEMMNKLLPDKLKMKLIGTLNVEKEIVKEAQPKNSYNSTVFNSNSNFNISGGNGSSGDIKNAVQESARALFQIELKKLVLNAGY